MIIGGTHLITDGAAGAWSSETAWSHSGGGVSPDGVVIPSWQTAAVNSSNGGSATLRNVPDVAMEADFDNFSCSMGQCGQNWAGTSFAAPRWAAFMALVNQQATAEGIPPLGFLNPSIYRIGGSSSYTSDFHDITSGNNNEYFIAPRPFFYAVPGYDLVTGWGSPAGQELIDALAPPTANGFRIAASPSSLTIKPGGSASITISVTGSSSFSGSVALSLTGLPSGVTGSFASNSVAGSTVLTIDVSSSAIRGSYLVGIVGNSGGFTATTSFVLLVDAPGFTIAPFPASLKIYPGTSGSTIMNVTDDAGFSGPIAFALTSPLPGGVTAIWSQDSSNGMSTLTLTASNSATPGSLMLTITGTSGTSLATTSVALSVQVPAYVLNISPIPFSIAQGTTATSTITVVPWGNFKGAVDLSAYQLPAGITAAFNPASTETTSLITWTASNDAPAGPFPAIIAGNASGKMSYSEFQQNVTAKPAPAFTVGVSPGYVTLNQGGSITDNITVTELNGLSGLVKLSVTQLPAGVTAALSPSSTKGSSLLTLSATGSAAVGTYVVSIWGSTGDQSSLSALYLNLTPAPCFTIGAEPASLKLVQGVPNVASVTVTPQAGFTGAVNLSIASALPNGLAASLGIASASGTSLLTVTASSLVPPGDYFMNISGKSGERTVTATISLSVEAAPVTAKPTFSLSAGIYSTAQSVSISDATPGATIYYTTDGSTPTSNSKIYTNPIAVNSTETLEAVAIASGHSTSELATAAYAIDLQASPALVIDSISPAFTIQGGQPFTLTVHGSGFTVDSAITWGTSVLSTHFADSTELSAQVSAAEIAYAGSTTISVKTPFPNGSNSNTFQFQVDSASSGTTPPAFSPSAATVSAGGAAAYAVTLPSSASSVSVACLNLPSGSTCAYSSTSHTVSITTSSTSPKRSYQITVVFTETLPGVANGSALLPILLLPLIFGKRKTASRDLWTTAFLGLLIMVAVASNTGCGGKAGFGSSTTTPPNPTYQVTSSGLVTLTTQ